MKVCPRCNQPKPYFNSNGICVQCDNIRYREMYARNKPDTNYLERHLAKREMEQRATECLSDSVGGMKEGFAALTESESKSEFSSSSLSPIDLYQKKFLRSGSKNLGL